MLPTISAEEKALIQAQVRAFVLPLTGLTFLGWIAFLYGFGHAAPSTLDWAKSHFLNPPDFTRCEPQFSAIIIGHIAFSHVATALGLFLMLATGFSRTINKQWVRERLAKTAGMVGLFFVSAAPILSKDFLNSGGRTFSLHFSDFCAISWDHSLWHYVPYLLPWLMFTMFAVTFCGLSFVLSANKQWLDPLSDDPEIAIQQLVIRLKYNVIDPETFDREMAARIPNYDPTQFPQTFQKPGVARKRNWLGSAGPVSRPILFVPGLFAAVFLWSAYREIGQIYHNRFWTQANAAVTGADTKCEMSYKSGSRDYVGALIPCDQAQEFVSKNAAREWTKTEVTFLKLSYRVHGKDVVAETRRGVISTHGIGSGDVVPIVYNPHNITEIDRPLSVLDIKQGFMVQIFSIMCFAAFVYIHRHFSLRSSRP
jgi:hypothetical protein